MDMPPVMALWDDVGLRTKVSLERQSSGLLMMCGSVIWMCWLPATVRVCMEISLFDDEPAYTIGVRDAVIEPAVDSILACVVKMIWPDMDPAWVLISTS